METRFSSRRLFLVAGTTAALSATLKSAAAAGKPGNDAGLFALSSEISLADEADREASAVHSAAEEIFYSATPPKPTLPEIDFSGEEWVKVLHAKMASEKNAPRAQELIAYDVALAEHERLRGRLRVDGGLAAAEQKQIATQDAVISLRNRLVETPATTLAGLIFKARYAASHYEDEYDPYVMASIVDDLVALDGGA